MAKKLNMKDLKEAKQIRSYEEADKKRGGRPKKANPRRNKATIYFTDEEYEKLMRQAESSERSLGEYLRLIILNKNKEKVG